MACQHTERTRFITRRVDGISPANHAEAGPFMRAINTLNDAPAIEALAREKDRTRLAWYRVRLHGIFDLSP